MTITGVLSMSSFQFRLPSILGLILLLGISGCSGSRERFNEDRYIVEVFSTDKDGFLSKNTSLPLPIKDIVGLCESSPLYGRLCWVKAKLPVGQVDNRINRISVFPQNVVVPGFVPIPHTIENGRATVLLLQVPPKQ